MTNWIIEQQLLISLVLLTLIGLEAKGIKSLGANLVYALWLLVPLLLIANNLPKEVIPVSDQSIYNYIVNVGAANKASEFSFNWDILWIVGCCAILSLGAFSQWQIHRLTKLGKQDLKLQAKLTKKLTVVCNPQFSGPVLSGIFKPILLIPENFCDQFSQRQQELIIAHELVHLRRQDNLFNLLAVLFVAVFWFNPIVWLAYKFFRRSQELACDAAVLEQANTQDKISYSKALVQCAERSLHSFSIYSPYGEKHTMFKRIKTIQNPVKTKPVLIGLSLALSTAMLASVALANLAETTHSVAKSDEATPIVRIEPKYPIEAVENNQEGAVILEFDINKDGFTENIQIIESVPKQVFDKVSVTALKQWKYKPRIQGGQAQRQTDLRVQLDYRLSQESTYQPVMQHSIEKIKVLQ